MQRRTLLKSLAACATTSVTHPLRALVANPPPRIALNQVGFLPIGSKIAACADPGPNRTFQLLSAGGKAVLTAPLTPATPDPASGDTLATADFSHLQTPGTYRLRLGTGPGATLSDPFTVASNAYAATLRTAIRGYTGQRCGCAVNLGNGYQHPPCHLASAYHPSSGRTGPFNNHGGWHDAGDYGRYVVNSGITTGTLLWAWELYKPALEHLHLDIPESSGPLPDYLAEIRWNLDWMLTLQDTRSDTDGGVWHKETSEQFCGFVMPQDDPLLSYVIGTGAAPFKSTCATADLAAVAAIAARCYRPYDAAYADRCLAAGRRAWLWATAHPSVPFSNPPGIGTGAYSDPNCSDELLWASAELWRTTGEPHYHSAFLAGLRAQPAPLTITAPNWASLASMACWTYALTDRPGDAPTLATIRRQTAAAAAYLIAQSNRNGYGNTLALTDYTWGSNGTAGNQSLLLLVADRLAANPAAVAAAHGNLDYLLGRNCFGVSWLTGVGARPFQHPHHRPSAADGIAAPWPGLLSGGPNAHPADTIAKTVPPGPPMRMWIDDQRAYSMNEIAINWNAPLVFTLASAT